MTFTTENTNGTFSDEQLDVLNEALEILVNEHEYDEQNASDKLNNAWLADDSKNTVELLIQRALN